MQKSWRKYGHKLMIFLRTFFIGAMFGCQTLFELRCALQLAELEREGVSTQDLSNCHFLNCLKINFLHLTTGNGFACLTIC